MMTSRSNRTILALLLCGLIGIAPASAAPSGTPLTNDMVSKYYAQCLVASDKEGTMTPESSKSYCACTSGQMKNWIAQEDIKAMSGQDQAARNVINKVLINVNAPCTRFPIHDMVYKECLSKSMAQGTCECLSNGIGTYLQDQSESLMGKILAANPNAVNPLGEIMNSPEYQKQEKAIAMSCIAKGR